MVVRVTRTLSDVFGHSKDDDKVDRSIRSVGMSFYSFHQVTLPQGFVIVPHYTLSLLEQQGMVCAAFSITTGRPLGRPHLTSVSPGRKALRAFCQRLTTQMGSSC